MNRCKHLESSPTTADSSDADYLQAGFRFALSLTHHREEAEDLVQETWMNLSRRYGGIESSALLFTSIRNLFVDQCRRKKLAYFESLDQPAVNEVACGPADEPCLKGDLGKLLGKLNPSEREAIYLHYYMGNTAEEISQITGHPRGTILSLIHRSVAKLRKMSDDGGDGLRCNQLLAFFVVLMTLARTSRT